MFEVGIAGAPGWEMDIHAIAEGQFRSVPTRYMAPAVWLPAAGDQRWDNVGAAEGTQ